MERDPVKAYQWYGLAAKNLDARGMEELEKLSERLTPQQIAAGRSRLIKFVKLKPACVSREIPLDEE